MIEQVLPEWYRVNYTFSWPIYQTKWCEETIGESNYNTWWWTETLGTHHGKFSFKDEKSAIMFVLRWL